MNLKNLLLKLPRGRVGTNFNAARTLERAMKEATDLTLRHDVPIGPDVPPDLRDERGRMFGTPQGFRVSGRMLPNDLLFGSTTATAPALMAAIPVLTLMMSIIGQVLGATGYLIGFTFVAAGLWLLNSTVQRIWVLIAGLVGCLLPLVGDFITRGVNFQFDSGVPVARNFGMIYMQIAGFAMPLLVVLGVSTALVWFFNGDRKAASKFLGWSLAFLAAACVSLFLPSFLQPVFWFAVGASPALMFAKEQKRTRALELALQGSEATMESTGKLRNAHVAARKQQYERAKNDKSTFITLGKAKGAFTFLHDGYSPDEGLPFGLTHNDLAQHFVCFGATGTGKTSRVLRPILKSVIQEQQRSTGLVLMDGKASLADEIRGVDSYTIIEPGVELALLEGLTPQDVAQTLKELNIGRGKGNDGDNSFFTGAAHNHLIHCAVLLDAFVTASKEAEKAGEQRQWFWTVKHLQKMLTLASLAADNWSESELGKAFLDGGLLISWGNSGARTPLVLSAMDYVKHDLAEQDGKTRSNIVVTAQQWLAPLLHDERLLKWSESETGFDITTTLQGAWVGVNLPELKYAKAGKMIQALLKRRVFNALRARADRDWKDAGESPVIFIIDEAQELVTEADRMILPVARSLGGRFVMATQLYESFQVAFNDTNGSVTDAFLGNFMSFVSFRSSERTYKFVSDRLGQVDAFTSSAGGSSLDYRFTTKMVLTSPLLDPKHPMQDEMRSLISRGVGSVGNARHLSKDEKEDSRHLEAFSRRVKFDKQSIAKLLVSPVFDGQWKTRQLLEPQEWSSYTAEDGVAIAQVQRAGAPRRDVITCAYIDSLRKVAKAA